MFKKLHSFNEDSQYTLNQDKKTQQMTYKKTFAKSSAIKKKNSSYGEKFRKKQHLLPQVPDLQIVQSDAFIFQGRLASVIQGSSLIPTEKEKHGEGVMFLKNGTLIIGFWDHGLLHGRALIFTPFGGKTIAEFYNGKLTGWAITLFAQKLVVCAIYYDNKIDGQKIIFEANQKMWVGSKYVQESNSFKIIHVQKGKMNELPDFLRISQSTDLIDLYDDFINNESCCMNLKQIQYVSITQNLSYIGYCNQEGHPSGLGAIFGKNEFYLGHFREGALECYGRMIFQNGQIYQGELLNGVFYGQGVYYNPSKNQSTIMSTTRQEQKILDEQEGYICINPQLNYFKYNKHGQTGIAGNSLGNICEIIEKYYSRFFIENKQPNSDNISARSEFGISQNVDDVEESMTKIQDLSKNKVKTPKRKETDLDQQKRWLNFNAKGSPSNDQKSHNDSGFGQSQVQLQRAHSLDKREASYNRKHLAEQSVPANFQEIRHNFKNHDQSLQEELNKLTINRNLSLGQRKNISFHFPDSTRAKQNIYPKQAQNMKTSTMNMSSHFYEGPNVTRRNTLNVNQKGPLPSSEEVLTFRNKNSTLNEVEEYRNQRKYSHMVEPQANFSPQQSVISNLSHKVQGMVNKTSSKRKKIFM